MLVAAVHGRSPGVVLRGAPDIGKSALLAAGRAAAEESGITVLTTVGTPAETRLPFAALHRLLRPLLARAAALPEPQRTALRAAFGEVSGAPRSATPGP